MIGQELPGENVTACRAKGFRVYDCALDSIPEQFSAAALLDVAEHVPRPGETFTAVARLLQPWGVAYIHTPRRFFLDTIFLRVLRFPGLRRLAISWLRTRVSIYHLQLWTDDALRQTLEQAGFKVPYMERERELSWPVEKYTSVYLRQKFHMPPSAVRVATWLARILFSVPWLMRNKAICAAAKVPGAS